MPTMANITVKANDGTTDVVYAALAGSSGETIPAKWRNDAAGGIAAFRKQAKVSAKAGAGSKRVVESLFVAPIVRTDTNGNTTQVSAHTVRVISTLDFSDSQSAIDEAVSQGINFAASTIVKNAKKEGYAPRG